MKKISLLSSCLIAGFLVSLIQAPGAVFLDGFSVDPSTNGWKIFGDTTLFHWNAANKNLEVTWDSSRPNSYFYHSIATTLTIDDAFSLEFDLRLSDATATGFFQLAVGLFNQGDAMRTNFSRASAASPNLCEFDYYPDGGFGPSIDATLADMTVTATNTSHFYFAYANLPLEPAVVYHVTLTHLPGEQTITGQVLTNGDIYTSLPNVFPGPITDFRLDAVSISSYTALDDPYGDSLLAHGTVDNLAVTLPPPPIANLTGSLAGGVWRAQFLDRTNWLYTLERTTDFNAWADVSQPSAGTGHGLVLLDTNAPPDQAFYRVRASRP